ncbi:MAG: hypothetical protein UR39_C0009G0024 [Candidatus Woesebacteria bacterium GW2011_GWA1_33_30]|uniref:Uncharacterized protein n=1 Tax=Candidatus Woesebacteria bacterium GW2011_GWA2_33_28 TaxID=1618561 RepID=A0A0G0CTK3_9BACT|nr:MAG: hypothetical protein UR38_C0009G0024 [Candidatus Woesebacteria bacterium GW2011_GWA2_33_28]KKP47553.1 MAG: hypothetical protein UR39_C0009G0024 [Candidatus Woesebacteria bacterium GW2011_GWA1_33_30]KKP49165.1 MAG: hypothetical protein UR40_C0010G0024 [Microgenomates group bacterium GW2011_GWC1_33_32]KKP51547.1 MAG: hypothetical protein UR44_C0009G0024 [Candidatus Woesebacteria bacterium GW2011_GWB1_33_38]KKP57731.1 MAG: hypothetical protein UR48_C0011G0019 [Microgenomates group bacteriu
MKKKKKQLVSNLEIRRLVVERLSVIPSNKGLSVGGNDKFYTKDQLINEVNKGSKIGEKIVKIEMEFLQSLKDLNLYESQITSNN